MFSHDVIYSKEASAGQIPFRKVFNFLLVLLARWLGRLVRQIGAAVQRWSVGGLNPLVWLGKMLHRRFERHKLRDLSDRQLIDTGIDLSHAGRGRAVAVDPITITILQSLR